MKYVSIVLLALVYPLLCHSQSSLPMVDTVYFLFNQQGRDSLCTYVSTSGVTPTEAMQKKYIKEVATDKQGNTKQISFHICGETFIYKVRKCSVDTLTNTANLKFSAVETANKKAAQKIATYIEENKNSPSLMVLYNRNVLNTYIIEKTPDQKLIKYQTEWVEKIE